MVTTGSTVTVIDSPRETWEVIDMNETFARIRGMFGKTRSVEVKTLTLA